jgi:hypothetical protein
MRAAASGPSSLDDDPTGREEVPCFTSGERVPL